MFSAKHSCSFPDLYTIFCHNLWRVAPVDGKYRVGDSAIQIGVHAVCPNPGRTSRTQLTTPEEKVRAWREPSKQESVPSASQLVKRPVGLCCWLYSTLWWRVFIVLQNTHTISNVMRAYIANKRSLNALAVTMYSINWIVNGDGWRWRQCGWKVMCACVIIFTARNTLSMLLYGFYHEMLQRCLMRIVIFNSKQIVICVLQNWPFI